MNHLLTCLHRCHSFHQEAELLVALDEVKHSLRIVIQPSHQPTTQLLFLVPPQWRKFESEEQLCRCHGNSATRQTMLLGRPSRSNRGGLSGRCTTFIKSCGALNRAGCQVFELEMLSSSALNSAKSRGELSSPMAFFWVRCVRRLLHSTVCLLPQVRLGGAPRLFSQARLLVNGLGDGFARGSPSNHFATSMCSHKMGP